MALDFENHYFFHIQIEVELSILRNNTKKQPYNKLIKISMRTIVPVELCSFESHNIFTIFQSTKNTTHQASEIIIIMMSIEWRINGNGPTWKMWKSLWKFAQYTKAINFCPLCIQITSQCRQQYQFRSSAESGKEGFENPRFIMHTKLQPNTNALIEYSRCNSLAWLCNYNQTRSTNNIFLLIFQPTTYLYFIGTIYIIKV